jgi:hypothetical protein
MFIRPLSQGMRTLAGVLAIAFALLRPGLEEGHLALPSLRAPEWWALLQRVPGLKQRQGSAVLSTATDLSHCPEAECDCAAASRLDAVEAFWFLAAGVALWPLIDVLRLAKLVWQQRVAAVERRLQIRPPDRP